MYLGSIYCNFDLRRSTWYKNDLQKYTTECILLFQFILVHLAHNIILKSSNFIIDKLFFFKIACFKFILVEFTVIMIYEGPLGIRMLCKNIQLVAFCLNFNF